MKTKIPVHILSLAIAICFVNGCANQLSTMTSPLYANKVTPVSSIGVTGQGASAASPAFIEHGYNVQDLGADSGTALDSAKSKSIPFVAIVDPIGTSTAWWNGFFNFSMRVTEMPSGSIVWSGTAQYGTGGVTINQVGSTSRAMRDMVVDFSKHFPPSGGK